MGYLRQACCSLNAKNLVEWELNENENKIKDRRPKGLLTDNRQ